MRIFFATDLHGSEVCFRKFLNSASFYRATKLFLGGDLSGKGFVPLWKKNTGQWESYFKGRPILMQTLAEKSCYARAVADKGFYTYEIEKSDYASLSQDQKSSIMDRLICDRLSDWISLAADKLKSSGTEIIVIAGNDDPLAIDELLSGSGVMKFVDGRTLLLDEGVQVLGYGYSTPTPWNTYREKAEGEIARDLAGLIAQLRPGVPTIFNVHVPPFDSGLDGAPALDKNLQPIIGSGGPLMLPVGSRAVRDATLSEQPILGLFGHVHEARAVTKVGTSLCVNPGSNYTQGRLSGVLATIKDGRVRDWQLTEG